MSLDFPEEDWLRLPIRSAPTPSNVSCKRALDKITEIQKQPHLSKHDAYLKIAGT